MRHYQLARWICVLRSEPSTYTNPPACCGYMKCFLYVLEALLSNVQLLRAWIDMHGIGSQNRLQHHSALNSWHLILTTDVFRSWLADGPMRVDVLSQHRLSDLSLVAASPAHVTRIATKSDGAHFQGPRHFSKQTIRLFLLPNEYQNVCPRVQYYKFGRFYSWFIHF